MDTFKHLLNNWEAKARQTGERVEYTLTLDKHDLIKIKALAQTYGLDEATITEGLLHSAVMEAEKSMPYVQGSEVIRVEDGEEVYADAGKTPAFVAAEQTLSKSMGSS